MKRGLIALFGVYGAVISALFAWVPRLWADEAATAWNARRDWPGFLANLAVVDGVHGSYYTLIRLWGSVFGLSEFSLRLPSALAIGATTAAIAVIGGRLGGRSGGLLSALLFPLLPTSLWMGAEARSYALSALMVCVLVLATIRAADSPAVTLRSFAIIVGLFVLSIYVFLYSAFMAVPIAVLLWPHRQQLLRSRPLLLLGAAALSLLPLILAVGLQRRQVAWIGATDPASFIRAVILDQYFGGNAWLAAVGWGALILGAVHGARNATTRPLTSTLAGWILAPTLVLGVTVLILSNGFYLSRYLAFTTPAVALLIGMGLSRVPRPVAGALLIALAVTAVGPVLERDDPMQRSSWDHALRTVGERAEAGDGWLAYSPRTQPVGYAYPDLFHGLTLINATPPTTRTRSVFPTYGDPLGDRPVAPEIRRVWMLVERERRDVGVTDEQTLRSQGFTLIWKDDAPVGPDGLEIRLFERTP